MTFVISIACAVIPSLLLLAYFYKKDLNPEPRHVLLITFLLGVLVLVPVFVVGLPGLLLLDTMSNPTLQSLFMAFILAAALEESFKFLVVFGYCSRHTEFDEPMDGMIYGAVASLGFATMENILFVTTEGIGVALSRALTAVPSHAFLGAIMGYFVAKARFGPADERNSNLLLALFLPILLHGAYDFPLMQVAALAGEGNDFEKVGNGVLLMLVVPIVVLIAEWIVVVVLLHRLRAMQIEVKEMRPFV